MWPVFDDSNLKFQYDVDSPFCIVTAYTDSISSWQKLGDFTSSTKESYCKKHGYGFRAYIKGFDSSRPASWSKLLFIKDTLRKYRWVFWMDADTAITNQEVKIEQLVGNEEIVMGQHRDGMGGYALNMGVFLLKSGEYADWLLQFLWDSKHCIFHHWWEQKAFMEMEEKGLLGSHLKIVRVKELDLGNPGFNMTHDTWKHGDFILHIGGMGVCRRLEMFKEKLGMVRGLGGACGDSGMAL